MALDGREGATLENKKVEKVVENERERGKGKGVNGNSAAPPKPPSKNRTSVHPKKTWHGARSDT